MILIFRLHTKKNKWVFANLLHLGGSQNTLPILAAGWIKPFEIFQILGFLCCISIGIEITSFFNTGEPPAALYTAEGISYRSIINLMRYIRLIILQKNTCSWKRLKAIEFLWKLTYKVNSDSHCFQPHKKLWFIISDYSP